MTKQELQIEYNIRDIVEYITYVYGIFQDEMNFGKLVQAEI